MNGAQQVCVALVLCFQAAAASSQTTPPVVTWSPSNAGSSSVVWNQSGNGWVVTLNRNSTLAPASVLVTSLTSEPIRFVNLNNGTDPWMTTLSVRGPSSQTPCGRVDSITAFDSGPAQIFELRMAGDLGGNLSGGDDAIEGFDNIGIVRITGNVLDTINANNSITDCEVLGDVSGDIIALGDGITSLVVGSSQVAGNLYGNVSAPSGEIDLIEVVNGNIGAVGALVSIDAAERITNLICDAMYANVDADSDGDGGDFTYYVQTTSGGFTGSFHADYYDGNTPPYGFDINGDLDADLSSDRWFSRPVTVRGTFLAGRTIKAGYTLGPTADMVFEDDGGLKGQVIVNAVNDSHAWNSGATVTIGTTSPITLSPIPFYNNKSSDIGGGAVGLVPYYCHYRDCTPTATKVNEASDGLDGLGECDVGYHASRKGVMGTAVAGPIIRHYGEVVRVGTGKPFTVREKPIATAPCDGGGNPNWTDVTSSFTITMHPGGDKRAYEIDGPFMPGNDDLIEPKVDNGGADYLACGGLAVSTVGLHDYDFRYRVFVLQDLNLSGGLETGDITAWMAEPVDTTGDGVADEADLIDVTEAVATWGE